MNDLLNSDTFMLCSFAWSLLIVGIGFVLGYAVGHKNGWCVGWDHCEESRDWTTERQKRTRELP